jgi:hypothetical protein
MCLRVKYTKKYGKIRFFASLQSLRKGVGSGSADTDPHRNVTDP